MEVGQNHVKFMEENELERTHFKGGIYFYGRPGHRFLDCINV
jgi:hypothetical protein